MSRALRITRFLLASVLVTVVGATAALTVWSLARPDNARSWRQAVTVGASAGGTEHALLRSVSGALSDEPQGARAVDADGLPATVTLPSGVRAAPSVVQLLPEDATPADERGVARLQVSIARAGMSSWVLRVPDPGSDLGSVEGLDALARSLAAIAGHRASAGGRVSVAATGALASQAAVASTRAPLAGRVDALLLAQPVADVQGYFRLVVTGQVRDARGRVLPHPAGNDQRREAGRALLAALRQDVPRSSLLEPLLEAAERSPDPLAALAAVPPELLTEELSSVRALLDTDDPDAFDSAWSALPASLRDRAAELSPLAVAERIDARVLLVVPVDDRAWPASDAELLQEAIGSGNDEARLVRTPLLDPGGAGAGVVGELRPVLAASAWWLRRAGA